MILYSYMWYLCAFDLYVLSSCVLCVHLIYTWEVIKDMYQQSTCLFSVWLRGLFKLAVVVKLHWFFKNHDMDLDVEELMLDFEPFMLKNSC